MLCLGSPKNPDLPNSHAEVVQAGAMCKRPGQCGGLAFSRGVQRVSRTAAVEGSEFVPLFLRPGSVLTPLSDTEALTSQYCSLCGEALSGGCSEEILHVGGDPCQWHHQFK